MKAQLVYQLRPGETRSHAIAGGEGLGRDAALPVRIDHDGVSRRHARIAREGEAFLLEDLGSTNGTFLNGRAISRERLRHLDVITLGKAVDIVFLLEPLPPSLPAPPAPANPARAPRSNRATRLDLSPEEARGLLEMREALRAAALEGTEATVPFPRPPPARRPPSPPSPRATAPAKVTPKRIAAVHLLAPGLSLAIDRPGTWSLGRDASAALRLEDTSVSRRHAELTLSDDRRFLVVRDLGSANGTELNEQPLKEAASVSNGDRIGCGHVILEVKIDWDFVP